MNPTKTDHFVIDPERQQQQLHAALSAKEFFSDFFSKICTAARKDGRMLDPLWRDLAEDDDDDDGVVEQEQETNAGATNTDDDDSENDSEDAQAKESPSAYYTTKILLCDTEENDNNLHILVRFQLEDFSMVRIPNNTVLSHDGWSVLQALSQSYIPAGASTISTLLRGDVLDMTDSSDASWMVPRFQFVCIEVCRIREGLYGRQFRRVLEVFDLKTQADRLEDSYALPKNEGGDNETSMVVATQEAKVLRTLQLLRTQWPNPSNSALGRTQLISILQTGTREGCSELVRSNCLELLDYWKQMKELGKIAKVLQIGGESIQKLRPALEKAGEALIEDLQQKQQPPTPLSPPPQSTKTQHTSVASTSVVEAKKENESQPQQKQKQLEAMPKAFQPVHTASVATQTLSKSPDTGTDKIVNAVKDETPPIQKATIQSPPSGDQDETHSTLLLLSRLRQLLMRNKSSDLLSLDESYGHMFYTDRFELLLLEGLRASHSSKDNAISEANTSTRSIAMANMAAVIHFCKLSEGDKETAARELVFSFGNQALDRKVLILRKARSKRDKIPPEQRNQKDATAIDDSNSNKHSMAALCDLTTAIIMDESILLSKLGFTSDKDGIAVLLAMLKAHASRGSLGCIGITQGKLEKVFSSWWYAASDRFSFLPGHATSAEEKSTRKVLVVFSSLDIDGNMVADWSNVIQKAISASPKLDVLQVLDPASSFFCQDPDCEWSGCDYYQSTLEELLQNYQTVMFVGEGSGASAALQFSSISDRVLAFAPVIKLSPCVGAQRIDIPEFVQLAFQEQLLETVKKTGAAITVHYARGHKASRGQMKLLPKKKHVELVAHEVEQLNLSSHLQAERQTDPALRDIIDAAIGQISSPRTPKQSNKNAPRTFKPTESYQSQ